MTEIEKLILAVDSKGASATNRELDKLDRNVQKVEKSGETMRKGWLAFAAIATTVGGAVYLVTTKLVAAARQFQDFNAQLKITTGSVEGATKAYGALVDFAAKTPFSVAQATQSFIKLANRGLTPSEEALYSYANTAISSGKQLVDVVDAVAAAVSGEYEQLKGLAISASKDGEKITFGFRGVKTEVANTAKAIENYVISIGKVKFAGAAAAAMETLTGAISNLSDAWDQLLTVIARGGPEQFITQGFKAAGDAVAELLSRISSGQLGAELNAYKILWSEVTDGIIEGFHRASIAVEQAVVHWAKLFNITESNVKDMFVHFPTYAVTGVRGITAQFEKFYLEARAGFKGLADNFSAEMDRLVSIGVATGAALRKSFSFGGGNAFAELETQAKGINQAIDARKESIATAYKTEVDSSREATDAVMSDIAEIMGEKNKAFDLEMIHAQDLRDAYEADKARRDADKTDKLAGFRLGSDEAAVRIEKAEKVKKQKALKSAEETAAQLAAIEKKNYEIRINAAEDFFGNIASIGSTFGEKGFKIAQAASIAQATIKTYEAATAAYAALAGIPYIGPALGAAAAGAAIVAGAANIAQIKAQKYAGAYAMGGLIPAGKYGLVGEAGPEIVNGPAVVTSAATTRNKRESSPSQNITIQNLGPPVTATTQNNGDELLLVLRPLLAENKAATKREIAGDIARGGSQLTTHLESTYGLRRNGK